MKRLAGEERRRVPGRENHIYKMGRSNELIEELKAVLYWVGRQGQEELKT